MSTVSAQEVINCQWPRRLSSTSLRFGNVSQNFQNPLSHYKCMPSAQSRGLAHWSICHTWNNRILILTLHQFHFTLVAKTPVELFHKHMCSWTNTHSSLKLLQELIFIISHISPLLSHCTQEFSLFLLYFKHSGTDCLFILFQSLFLVISVKWVWNNNSIQTVSRQDRSNYWAKAHPWSCIAYQFHKSHLTSHWNLFLILFGHVGGLLSVKSWWQSNPWDHFAISSHACNHTLAVHLNQSITKCSIPSVSSAFVQLVWLTINPHLALFYLNVLTSSREGNTGMPSRSSKLMDAYFLYFAAISSAFIFQNLLEKNRLSFRDLCID